MSSFVLNKLKSVKERIETNYSTEQLIDTLDRLIYRSIQGVIQSSNYLDSKMITIATWYSTNQRRKLSSLDKGQFIASSMAFLLADQSSKLKIYKKIGIERNLSVMLIQEWMTLAKECTELEIEHLKSPSQDKADRISHLRWRLCVTDPHQLYPKYHTVKYYIEEALSFREQIAEKYMRKVMKDAVAYHKEQTKRNGARMDQNDVAQNFMLAVYKAIDKCDPRKGTLTAYVDKWLINAKTTNHFRHENGIAFTIPSGQRKQLATGLSSNANYALSIDDAEVRDMVAEASQEENLMRQDTINLVRQLAKTVDPTGFGRISLGISETLNAEELEQLRAASATQLS